MRREPAENAEKGCYQHVQFHHVSPFAVKMTPPVWRDDMISGTL
jgi:hypothetical protein